MFRITIKITVLSQTTITLLTASNKLTSVFIRGHLVTQLLQLFVCRMRTNGFVSKLSVAVGNGVLCWNKVTSDDADCWLISGDLDVKAGSSS